MGCQFLKNIKLQEAVQIMTTELEAYERGLVSEHKVRFFAG
jgi:hypothetical protein